MGNTGFQGTALTESGSQDFSQDKAPMPLTLPPLCAAVRGDGGAASTISEWPHLLTVESGGPPTFSSPTSQSLFAGALGRTTEASALRLLKHHTSEYSQIYCTFFCLPAVSNKRNTPEEWQDHALSNGSMLSVAIKSLPGQVARADGQGLQKNCSVTLSVLNSCVTLGKLLLLTSLNYLVQNGNNNIQY